MRLTLGVIALAFLAVGVIGCGAKEEPVSNATPQSVGNAGSPTQLGGNANPNAGSTTGK